MFGSGNNNCAGQTLTNIQNVTGTLSLDDIVAIVVRGPEVPSESLTDLLCTDCMKETYNIFQEDAPGTIGSVAGAREFFMEVCGADFVGEYSCAKIFNVY